MSETSIDWAAITAALQAPIDPAEIDFRPQGEAYERNGEYNGRVLAYIDARTVMHRLDSVVGAQNWAGCPDPLIMDNAVRVVRYALTIHGVTKYAIGDAGATEPSKSADSDGLKRAAVVWGIGRDLYALESEWVKAIPSKNKRGEDSWRIADGEVDRLRKKLAHLRAGQQRQQGQGAVVTQDARNGREATPSTPQSARAASLPAGVGSESANGTPARISATDKERVRVAVNALGWGDADRAAYLASYGVAYFSELTAEQAAEVVPDLQTRAAQVQDLVNVP